MVNALVKAVQDGSTVYRWMIGLLISLLLLGTSGYIAHSENADNKHDASILDLRKEQIRLMERMEDKLDVMSEQLKALTAKQQVLMFKLGVTSSAVFPFAYKQPVTGPQSVVAEDLP